MNVCDDSSIYLENRENLRRSDTKPVIAPFLSSGDTGLVLLA
jgi:hypothetical protein